MSTSSKLTPIHPRARCSLPCKGAIMALSRCFAKNPSYTAADGGQYTGFNAPDRSSLLAPRGRHQIITFVF